MRTLEKNKKYVYIKKKKDFSKSWNGLPATSKITIAESSLYESFFASIVWHIIGLLLIWLISFLLVFWGLTPKIFPKPETKKHDIEFILKNRPIHKIHYHKVETVVPQSTIDQDAQKEKTSSPMFSQPKRTPSVGSNNSNQKSANPSNHRAHDAKLTSRNTSNSRSSMGKPHSGSGITPFSMPMQNLNSMSSGLGGTGKTRHQAAGVGSGSSGGGFGGSSASGKGSGGAGFDKATTRKLITSYDISPYVNELRRNIRWNWKVPKNAKRVELFIRIAKDGRIIILNVKRTSEIGDVDNAALNAVRRCAPLRPLPAKYNKSFLDIVFTFDSSVSSRY